MRRGRNWKVSKFHHIVLSPPSDKCYTLSSHAKKKEKVRLLKKLFDEAKKILDYVGAYDGGYSLFHPYRLKIPCDYCDGWFEPSEFEEHLKVHHLEESKVKEIKKKLERDKEDFRKEGRKWSEIRKKDNWRDYVYWSPHFHALIVAPFIDGAVCEKTFKDTGWIVHRVTKKGNRKISVSNLEDLVTVLTYLFSHVGINHEVGKTYRYFGDITKFKVYPSKKKEIRRLVDVAFGKGQYRLRDSPKVRTRREPFVCPFCGSSNLEIIFLKPSLKVKKTATFSRIR